LRSFDIAVSPFGSPFGNAPSLHQSTRDVVEVDQVARQFRFACIIAADTCFGRESIDYALWEIAAVAGAFLAAGIVKGGIGMGLPTVGMALMGLWLPVEQAAAILILPVTLTNVYQSFFGTAFRLLMHRIWSLMLALIVGTLAAAALIAEADTALAAALLGGMLIVYAALGLSGLRFNVPVRTEPVLNPVIGLLTGLITGATAIFVIPSVPYLQSVRWSSGRPGREDDPGDPTRARDEKMEKDALIQSLGLTALVATVGLALGLGSKGALPLGSAVPGIAGTLAAFFGMTAGAAIRDRLSLEVFRRWVLCALLALGVLMVVRAVT
jgi:uncharacterized membrane protein YfcA